MAFSMRGLPFPALPGEGGSGAFSTRSTRGEPPSPDLASLRSTSQSKSDVSDFDQLDKCPKSGKPDFGCRRGEVNQSTPRHHRSAMAFRARPAEFGSRLPTMGVKTF